MSNVKNGDIVSIDASETVCPNCQSKPLDEVYRLSMEDTWAGYKCKKCGVRYEIVEVRAKAVII